MTWVHVTFRAISRTMAPSALMTSTSMVHSGGTLPTSHSSVVVTPAMIISYATGDVISISTSLQIFKYWPNSTSQPPTLQSSSS